MTSLKANEILKNKFWIIEDADSKTKVGTLSKDNDNRYMYIYDVIKDTGEKMFQHLHYDSTYN